MHNGIRVVLPEHYDLVVGDTFQLFYRGVIEAVDPYQFDIVALCECGKNFPRYFEYTPEEEGNHILTISVYDEQKKLLGQGKTTLNVYQVRKSPESSKNILCVGDSLTEGGIWVEEAFRRITGIGGVPAGHALSNINFIGSRTKNAVGFEGVGGWTWNSYLSPMESETSAVWIYCQHNADEQDQHSLWSDVNGTVWQMETIEENRIKLNRYQAHTKPFPESGTVLNHYKNAEHIEPILIESLKVADSNPFWNHQIQNIDFEQYCMENGFDGIDAVYTLLTWNALFEMDRPDMDDYTPILSSAKKFVDRLHEQFPNAKIKVMGLQIPSINGGTGKVYGAVLPYCDDYGLTRWVLGLNMVYQQWANEEKYRDFLEFINISGQFDSENNMPSVDKTVNIRSTKTERVGSSGVHPMKEGYLQIADAVYRNMIKYLNEQ